jgi:hypothetical protein
MPRFARLPLKADFGMFARPLDGGGEGRMACLPVSGDSSRVLPSYISNTRIEL